MNLKIIIHCQYQHLKVISFTYSHSVFLSLFVFLECVKKIISYMEMQPYE